MKKITQMALTGTVLSGLLLGLGAASSAASTAGSLDTTFGKGGVVLTNLGLDAGGSPINAVPSDAAMLPNGDLMVAGNFGFSEDNSTGTTDIALVRYLGK